MQKSFALITCTSLLCLALSYSFETHFYSRKLLLKDIEDPQTTLMEYGQVALYMVMRYISPRTNTLIIMEHCLHNCDDHRLYHSTVLKFFLNNLNYSMATQLYFGQPEERPWDYNLFLVPTWKEFELSVLSIFKRLTRYKCLFIC